MKKARFDSKALWNISPNSLILHNSSISLNNYCSHPSTTTLALLMAIYIIWVYNKSINCVFRL